jgi:Tfp pilus assembly protein PilV
MKKRRVQRGMTLLEIVVGVFVLSMTIVTTTAMFSSSALLRNRSNGFTRASAIVTRKLEQIRNLDSSELTSTGLKAAGVIDQLTYASNTYTFTSTDDLASNLVQASSSMTVTGAGTDLAQVEVTVNWRGYRGKLETMRAMTYVADKSAWREP